MLDPMHRLICCCIAMATVGAVQAIAAEIKPLQPLDIFEIEVALDPQVSPTGERIVYVRERADTTSDTRYSTLWSIDASGDSHRAITTGARNDVHPRWSPAGDRIAYISAADDGQTQIRVRWMDTGDETIVTNLPNSPSSVAWSPDGTWLAFIMPEGSEPPSIAEMPTAPEGAQWAAPAQVTEQFVYRYDGRGYFDPEAQHLYVVPADGGTPRDIGELAPTQSSWAPVAFGWTPSGESIVFSSLRDEQRLDRPQNTDIYEIALASGDINRLTDREGPDNGPKVSPDGQYIAYTGFDDRYQSYQTTQLYVMDRTGANPRSLTTDLDRDIAAAEWDAESGGLFIMYDDAGKTVLGYVDLNGVREVLSEDLGTDATAYTFGASFSIAEDQRFVFPTAGPDFTGEVAIGRRGEAGTRRLTNLNGDVLGHRDLGRLEEIRYESSKDGLPIQGWLIYPPGFDESQKYPLILELHGAPTAYGPRFDIEKQLMAAAGYIVLYVNYRGSTSYGEDFANIIHHAYPGDEFFDLVSGVDAAIENGNIDESRIYISGGSGGGVLTAWTIARTDRFRGAAALYPVIDWTSWVLTADMAADGMTYWFPGAPWESPENYAARSLLKSVADVKTPTIVIVGTEDYRTPEHQAEIFYRALKWQGIDSALVRIPGENHGARRRPSHQLSKVLHVIGWFERYK